MHKKFLFIDVGDTLIKLRYSVSEMYSEVLLERGLIQKINPEELQLKFKLAWREVSTNLPPDNRDRYRNHPNGHIGWWRELIDSFLFRLTGKKNESDEIYDLIFKKFDEIENWKVDPSFYDLLFYLKDKPIGLGIISNWDTRLRELLRNLKVIEYFDPILISAEFGYEKPSPRIFEEGMRLTNLKPEDYFYVGDKIELDYYPPENLGWKSFLISDTSDAEIRCVKNLGELVNYICV